MPGQSRKHPKRVRNLVAICTLIAVILSVSTYAWFIGMRTVHVSTFDVEIAATDSLWLSLDGKKWGTTVNISKATYNITDAEFADRVYEGHTNNWAGRGLIPMSSIGQMDISASRMKLFEKASLTSTPGGYRLMASRVHNYESGNPEQDGYVVFDLFVRNFSGPQYLPELNELDEEAIYLTVDSDVSVASTGVANTGIENSVRVAFAQIGRVSGDVAGGAGGDAIITGITCTSDTNVTGICRTAQIWEPNDTDHVKNAINWYETSCLKRTGANVTLSGSYSGSCGLVIDGLAYPTYAISDDITSADNIDIYDGPAYNSYTPNDDLLVSYPYFTDTMKFLTSTDRPTFMTLAPNSITKIRVYIYIEGQDVDNYDFASIGKMIAVKFGFTKERYTEDDINYNGPDLNQGDGPHADDLTPPVITLKSIPVEGPVDMTIAKGGTYNEPGATATDNKDGDLSTSINISGTVNTAVPGKYRKLYQVTDAAGNTATKVRYITVTE